MSVRNGILGLLENGPKYGFQIKKEFEERTGDVWQLNVGQVYTTLDRLVRDELVVEQQRANGEDGHDDQRLYRLTESGHEALIEWFDTPRPRSSPERDELVIKLTIAEAVTGIDRIALIQQQRESTTEVLQRFTKAKVRTADDNVSRLIALDSIIGQIDAELRWLDACEARIRADRSARTKPATRTRTSRTTS